MCVCVCVCVYQQLDEILRGGRLQYIYEFYLLTGIYTYIYQHLGVILGGGRVLQRAPCVCVGGERGSGGSCIREHTSAYAIREHTSGYASIRQHTSAYVTYVCVRRRRGQRRRKLKISNSSTGGAAGYYTRASCVHTSAYVSRCLHTSADVSVCQHTSAYVSICQHARKLGIILEGRGNGLALLQHPYYIRCFVPLRMRAS